MHIHARSHMSQVVVDAVGARSWIQAAGLCPEPTSRNNTELAKQKKVGQKTYLPCVLLLSREVRRNGEQN
jgi:hypothetical protein